VTNFAHFVSIYVIWTAIPILVIIGIIFWKKQKNKRKLSFRIRTSTHSYRVFDTNFFTIRENDNR